MKIKPSSLKEMSRAQILHRYPNLTNRNWRKTSDPDKLYNCVAHALGIKTKWIDFYFLPTGELNHDLSCNSYVKFFSKKGFSVCGTTDYEEGKIKIALYENKAGHFTHVAIQLSATEWTSKLGEFEDIAHIDLDSLEGVGNPDRYGIAAVFMEKSIS